MAEKTLVHRCLTDAPGYAPSFVLFSFVGVPETTTITADGISTTISWGHVILYGALGLVGALVFWAGSADH